MKKRFHKLVAPVLALLIFALPGALFARERRGANIVVTLKEGQTVFGELITVKPDSLLMFSGKDESVDLVGIRSIRIVKKSKALLGTACGFLAALAVTAAQKGEARLGAILYIPAGLVIGAGAGLYAGKDKIIRLEGMSEPEVGKALAYLRGRARIRDYK